MPEIKHELQVKQNIDDVWKFAGNICNFAESLPGCESCEVLDDAHSHWIVRFNVGPLNKALQFDVEITEFDPGNRLRFDMTARNDPVTGYGEFKTIALSEQETKIKLALAINGRGPLAPMMEALSSPLMPGLAKDFSDSLVEALGRNQ